MFWIFSGFIASRRPVAGASNSGLVHFLSFFYEAQGRSLHTLEKNRLSLSPIACSTTQQSYQNKSKKQKHTTYFQFLAVSGVALKQLKWACESHVKFEAR